VRSVRARVTFTATLIVLLVLAATGAALATAQSAVLTENVDEVLVRHGRTIEAQLDAVARSGTIPGMGDDDSFAHVIDESGRVLASTPGKTADLPIDGMDLEPATGDEPRFQTVPVAGEPDYRVMIQSVGEQDIIVGTPLDEVRDSVAALSGALLIAVPAASFVLALFVWILVGRVLHPIERMRQRLAAIGGESLDQRIPVPGSQDEVARLAKTMNGMLERIESSSERQRRFVADASHELRGPLTRIRTEIEVDLAHPESADLLATHRSILDDTEGLEILVEDLLTLAKSDDGSTTRRREPVDLDDIVLAEVQRLRTTVPMEIDVSEVSGAQVIGDRSQLARVVRNLLDNALRHGCAPVRIVLREEPGEAVLRICDDGPGIPVEFHERIFERFARIDEARNATRSTGLGLAIARDIVVGHGGTIAIDDAPALGVCFEVRLPR